MVKTVDIIATSDRVLQPSGLVDYGPNGLQVPGREAVERLVTGVSATRALIERAIELEAGLILCHHGLFWESAPRALSPVMAERLRLLLGHGIGLAAYHLPLDAHPEHGNNALLAEALGCESHEPFAVHGGRPIGRVGRFGGDGIEVPDLLARVREVAQEPLWFKGGPKHVRTIGIVSGSGAGDLPEALALGLDAFLTGEPREHVMADALEGGIHFIAAGHYATEMLGIRRLGELLAAEHGVEHVFVDLPNPV